MIDCDFEAIGLYAQTEHVVKALGDGAHVVSLCMPAVSGAGPGGGIHVNLDLSQPHRYARDDKCMRGICHLSLVAARC
jgi:hypothetical protein